MVSKRLLFLVLTAQIPGCGLNVDLRFDEAAGAEACRNIQNPCPDKKVFAWVLEDEIPWFLSFNTGLDDKIDARSCDSLANQGSIDGHVQFRLDPYAPIVEAQSFSFSCSGKDFYTTNTLYLTVSRSGGRDLQVQRSSGINQVWIEGAAQCPDKICNFSLPDTTVMMNANGATCAWKCGDVEIEGCSVPVPTETSNKCLVAASKDELQAILKIGPQLVRFDITKDNSVMCSAESCVTKEVGAQLSLALKNPQPGETVTWPAPCSQESGTVGSFVFNDIDIFECIPTINTPIPPNGVPVTINLSGHVGADTNNIVRYQTGPGISCLDDVCSGMAEVGTQIYLEPVPDQSSAFDNWGACANNPGFSVDPVSNILTISVIDMMPDIVCEAVFKEAGGCTGQAPVITNVSVTAAGTGTTPPMSGSAYLLVDGEEYRFVAEVMAAEGTVSWEVLLGNQSLHNAQGLDLNYTFTGLGGGAIGIVRVNGVACDGTPGMPTDIDFQIAD